MNCKHQNVVLKSAHFQQFLYCMDCKKNLHAVWQKGREVRLTTAELKAAQRAK